MENMLCNQRFCSSLNCWNRTAVERLRKVLSWCDVKCAGGLVGAPPLLSSLPVAGPLPPRSPSGFNKPVQERSVSLLGLSQHDSRFPRISRTGSLGNFTLESMADWFLLVDERITPRARLKVFSDGFLGEIKKRIPQHFLLLLSVRSPPLFLLH